MRERIARSMDRWRRTLFPATGRHRTTRSIPVRVAVPAPSPTCVAAWHEDSPTLQLPRIPPAERYPIAWDADPVPLYVLRHERQRALGAAR
ncbi:hypothetical protein GCM10022420_024090 [Streptomyces iranensis]|uniref:Uncharacterized protein n=1 Tax=Streptomyces iranensis TaxID=576784 RepID=A0ABS4MYY6_9ACTN|nr:hypothetical protein [Streptomyces iranensis]